jgi:hypothetical protein
MQSEKLNQIMESHPLAVLMVLTAVERFTAEVAATTPEDYPPMGLVNPESWIELAKSIQDQLTDRKAFK